MAVPYLALLGRDPNRGAVPRSRLPDQAERKGRLEEVPETARKALFEVPFRTQRPAHHRLVHERASEHLREGRQPRRVSRQPDHLVEPTRLACEPAAPATVPPPATPR